MRVIAGCIAALCLVASPAMAGANPAGGNAGAQPNGTPASNASTSTSASSSPQPETVSSASDLQQLKELIEAQTKMLEQQQQQLNQQQQEMNALKQQLSVSGSNSGVIAAPLTAAPAAAIGPVVGVSAANAVLSSAAPAKPQTAPADQPANIKFKGVTLTPSGFFAGEAVWRQKALASDVNTPFNSVPFAGASQAHMSEFNGSGRQSRIAMLVQGKVANATLSGYYEMDFLSAGTTSNNNQSNSYTLRQRQFWGQAAFTNGFTFTGGQQWSLLTETTTGMNNRTENLPMTIDAQYHVGFSWARQFGFRITKSFNNKFWLGASVEQGQATVTVHGNPTVNSGGTQVVTCTNPPACTTTGTALVNPTVQTNFLVGAFGTSGGLYNPLGNYQFNPSPDVIVKAVAEPGFGHYEVFGLLADFRDRVFPCVPITGTATPGSCTSTTSGAFARNDNRVGGGFGANARWAILSNKVDKMDIGIHFLGGSGTGRYGSAGLADATTRPDGTLALIRNYQTLATIQLHPVPKLDIYFNGGLEYEDRAQYAKTIFPAGGVGTANNEGYGALGLANSGCWTETQSVNGPVTTVPTGVGGSAGFIPGSLANCTGDARNLVEGTVGFWYRFYNGPMGRFQWGMQFSDYVKNTWHGTTTIATGIGSSGQPTANQNMVFTSFRYYIP